MQGKPHIKGSDTHKEKVYSPPLPYTYNETELSEDINGGMECVFRDFWRSLKQAKDPILTMNDVVNLMCKLTQSSWRIIKNYRVAPVTYRTR